MYRIAALPYVSNGWRWEDGDSVVLWGRKLLKGAVVLSLEGYSLNFLCCLKLHSEERCLSKTERLIFPVHPVSTCPPAQLHTCPPLLHLWLLRTSPLLLGLLRDKRGQVRFPLHFPSCITSVFFEYSRVINCWNAFIGSKLSFNTIWFYWGKNKR